MTTIFERRHKHKNAIDTAANAARAAKDLALHHKAMVRRCLEIFGPQSSAEIAAVLGLDTLQVMKRISDLRADRVVVDTGRRVMTAARRPAAVWALAEGAPQ